MSMQIDHGVTGAHRASWRDVNPRSLLQHIIEDNPSGPESRWRELFWQQVHENEDYLRAVAEYWLDNNVRSILAERSGTKRAQKTMEQNKIDASKNSVTGKLRDRIEREAQIILFDLIMPNGKKLPQCTGAECRTFGGWFTKLADKVPAKKKVGNVLSEGEVRKLYLAAQPQ